MLITLSPSKGQDFDSPFKTTFASSPEHIFHSNLLIKELRKLSASELRLLMNVSENIANLNVARYKSFKTPFTNKNAKPALFAFKGDVYGSIPVSEYSKSDLKYAQEHLRILSGLYGALRPMDLIQPYRLEMKTKLHNPRGENLYQFWGDKITESLNKTLANHSQPVLINLASNEYFKSVNKKRLQGRLLNISFKETKKGKTRVIAIFAKRARGLMTDYILRNRLEKPEDIKDFNRDGYRYSAKDSTESQWVFDREQPLAK
jgi:cytoplasmic iron level regulating protein YaaA (DUF328/UPF0246 family)